jgi:hypothetical protein
LGELAKNSADEPSVGRSRRDFVKRVDAHA